MVKCILLQSSLNSTVCDMSNFSLLQCSTVYIMWGYSVLQFTLYLLNITIRLHRQNAVPVYLFTKKYGDSAAVPEVHHKISIIDLINFIN